MSFAVMHPFDKDSYPKDIRKLWSSLPQEVRQGITQSGRRFGYHAMVVGAVPIVFNPEDRKVLENSIDGKYIQRIPITNDTGDESKVKLWIDADLLNYSKIAEPERAARWKLTVIPGGRDCVLRNAGDGAAIDVDVTTGNGALGLTTSNSTVWVEPEQGIMLSFREEVPEGSLLQVQWSAESGENSSASIEIPAPISSSAVKHPSPENSDVIRPASECAKRLMREPLEQRLNKQHPAV